MIGAESEAEVAVAERAQVALVTVAPQRCLRARVAAEVGQAGGPALVVQHVGLGESLSVDLGKRVVAPIAVPAPGNELVLLVGGADDVSTIVDRHPVGPEVAAGYRQRHRGPTGMPDHRAL